MARRVIVFAALLIFIISLTGCATTRKSSELEIQGLRNQISVLEAQIKSKDEEINSLKESLERTIEEKESQAKQVGKQRVISGRIKSRPKVKHIQIALLNAGYNPGKIDGRMGKRTIEAIKSFQKANNLPFTGKVDKQTWDLLMPYLYKHIK